MGWWRTSPEGDDIIGDGPADMATAAIRSLAQEGTKPSLHELVDALAHVLRTASGGLVEPAAPPDLRVEARVAGPSGSVTSGPATSEQPLVAHVLEGALRAIAGDYLDSLDRLPRIAEVLATFAFVLRPEPHEYLGDEGAIELIELRVA